MQRDHKAAPVVLTQYLQTAAPAIRLPQDKSFALHLPALIQEV